MDLLSRETGPTTLVAPLRWFHSARVALKLWRRAKRRSVGQPHKFVCVSLSYSSHATENCGLHLETVA